VDTWLAIASKRDERRYADRPIPEEVERRILDAGRLSGNSQNNQTWEFVVVSDRAALAETVYYAPNVQTCALAAAVKLARPSVVEAAAVSLLMMSTVSVDGADAESDAA